MCSRQSRSFKFTDRLIAKQQLLARKSLGKQQKHNCVITVYLLVATTNKEKISLKPSKAQQSVHMACFYSNNRRDKFAVRTRERIQKKMLKNPQNITLKPDCVFRPVHVYLLLPQSMPAHLAYIHIIYW